MAGDDRPMHSSEHIPERAIVQMRHIHEHVQILQPRQRPSAELREPAGRICFGAGGQRICFVPGEHGVARAKCVEPVDRVHVLTDRRQAFDAEQDRKALRRSDALDLRRACHQCSFVAFRHFCCNCRQELRHPRCRIVRKRRIDPEHKTAATNAASAQLWQMMARQHLRFSAEPSPQHICKNITMSVKDHRALTSRFSAYHYTGRTPD